MFERFTDDSRRVVLLAQEECRELVDRQIRSEHLLLALLRERGSEGERVLAGLGVDWDRARAEVLGRLPRGNPRGRDASGYIPFTRNAKRVMERGAAEAARLDCQVVSPALLLRGMLSIEECGAAAVLRALGIDPVELAGAAERAALEREPDDAGSASTGAISGWVRAGAQPRSVPAGLRDLAGLLERVARERDRMERALLRYGRHDDACAGAAACTCGLEPLLDEIIESGGDEAAPPNV